MYLGDGLYLNCKCDWCGNVFHRKRSNAVRNDKKTHFCDKECFRKYKVGIMSGKNNHQYGLRGRKNASWKRDERISTYGYKEIRRLDHPFRRKDDFVFEHRLVAEKYLLNSENSVEIDGKRYLKRDYHVHHLNGNKLDNRVENLLVLTKGEHSRLHNYLNPRKHDALGRFI